MTPKPHPQAYVAIGAGGLLKVGYSRNVKQRSLALRKEFKAKGDVMTLMHMCDPIEAAYSVECELIRHCARIYPQHSGREWFVGGDFHAVAAEAVKFTEKWRRHKYPKPMSLKKREAIEREYAQMHEQRKAERAEAEAYWAKRSAVWRAKRNRSQNVIDQIVSFALKQPSPSLPLSIQSL